MPSGYCKNHHNDHTHRRQNQHRPDTSLDTELRIVKETSSRGSHIQPEHGIPGDNTAVRQPENNILGKIPCRMHRDRRPQAVIIVDKKPIEHADNNDLGNCRGIDSGISHMQSRKEKCAHRNRHPGLSVTSSELLIQIAPIHQFLRTGLNKDRDKEQKKKLNVDPVKREHNVSLECGNKSAGSICRKTEQNTQQRPADIAPVLSVCKAAENRPVSSKNKRTDHKSRPDSDKTHILIQKGSYIRVSGYSGKQFLSLKRVIHPQEDQCAGCEQQISQHKSDRNEVRPASGISGNQKAF